MSTSSGVGAKRAAILLSSAASGKLCAADVMIVAITNRSSFFMDASGRRIARETKSVIANHVRERMNRRETNTTALSHPRQYLAEPALGIGPGHFHAPSAARQQCGNGRRRKLVAIFGMDALAAREVETPGQALDPDCLLAQAFQVHFDARSLRVPESHVAKGVEIEPAA